MTERLDPRAQSFP